MTEPTRRRGARRRTRHLARRPEPVRQADFPHVTAFLRGYLHEDAFETYVSPREACAAYLAETGEDEREAFERERAELGRRLSSLPAAAAARSVLDALGAA